MGVGSREAGLLVAGAGLFILAPLAATPAMARTLVHRTALDASAGRSQGLAPLPFAEGLFVTTAASASYESSVLESPEPFDDLVGSWSAEVPPGGSLEMQAQARLGSDWTAWYSLGVWDGGRFVSAEAQEDDSALVDIDTLKLKRPASALRYRLLLRAGKRPVRVRLAAVAVSGPDAPAAPPDFRPGPWVRELKAKPRSQMVEQEKYKHDICSPTSLAMALEFWSKRMKTTEVADAVRDQRTGKFGVWPANTAAAAALGLEAWVARLESVEDLQEEVAAGRPVVVSLTFAEGELSGSPLKKTRGHLVLVTGFDDKGDVVTLDPAAPDRASVRRVYRRAEFHRAWRVKKRGLAYLVSPLAGRLFTVGVPVADLWAEPKAPAKPVLHDLNHLTQLLYGERVRVRAARGDWAEVEALEQPDFASGKRWQGYPGWVRADALSAAAPPPANVVVRTRQALLQRTGAPRLLTLSVGTRLRRLSQDKGLSRVLLLDGTQAELPTDALSAPPSAVTPESRAQIIKTAELFLGTSYYWGGRSGVQPDLSIGVDCSGLVSLAYRIHGLDLPRDSHEQKLKSRPVAPADLRPGDLVFLSNEAGSRTITHVMIFTGGDGIIESRKSSGRVLRSSFKERFGRALLELKAGDAVLDHSLPKPRERLIFFGSYL